MCTGDFSRWWLFSSTVQGRTVSPCLMSTGRVPPILLKQIAGFSSFLLLLPPHLLLLLLAYILSPSVAWIAVAPTP